jgi:hypothetical protein
MGMISHRFGTSLSPRFCNYLIRFKRRRLYDDSDPLRGHRGLCYIRLALRQRSTFVVGHIHHLWVCLPINIHDCKELVLVPDISRDRMQD